MIDVLMSTFNGARFLGEQIDSILSQDHADFHLLVRDDGSNDDTLRILKDHSTRDKRIVLIEDDLGNLNVAASFFELTERSESEFLMLADQDDVWLPNKIAITFAGIKELIEKHGGENPLAVFTDLKVVDEKLNIISESFWDYQRLDPDIAKDWRSLLAQNVVTGCTLMFNRPAKEIILPFKLPAMMHDHWIAARIAKFGHLDYIPEPTVLYRQHGRNLEGARSAGFSYLISKIPETFQTLSQLKTRASVFGDVSTAGLIAKKLSLNLKRLSSR